MGSFCFFRACHPQPAIGTKATGDLGLGGGRRVEEPVLSHVRASTCGRETSPLPGQLRICLLETCVLPQGLQEGALCV